MPRELPFVPLRSQPPEALRLLDDYAGEFPAEHRDWLEVSLGPVREEVRAGTAEGVLWWGPHDEAVGLALWKPVEGLGRRVSDLYLAPGFRSSSALRLFVSGVEGHEASQGPVVAVPGLIPGVEEESQAQALTPLGFRPQSRLALRRRTDLPFDRPPKAPPGKPIRNVVEDDGLWITRLYREAFEGSVDRFWVDHGDLEEDARRMWKDLLGERWGPWLSSASFTHDRPGGVDGATLVCHPKGRCPLLLQLMVEPETQGKGLGRALLSRTLASLARAGIEELELNVVRENLPAFHLYTAMGFVAVPGTEARFWVRPSALPAPSHAR